MSGEQTKKQKAEKIMRTKNRRFGFTIIEVMIVVVIVALIVFGGWYVNNLKHDQTIIQVGQSAEQKALDAAKKLEEQSKAQEKLLNQLPR